MLKLVLLAILIAIVILLIFRKDHKRGHQLESRFPGGTPRQNIALLAATAPPEVVSYIEGTLKHFSGGIVGIKKTPRGEIQWEVYVEVGNLSKAIEAFHKVFPEDNYKWGKLSSPEKVRYISFDITTTSSRTKTEKLNVYYQDGENPNQYSEMTFRPEGTLKHRGWSRMFLNRKAGDRAVQTLKAAYEINITNPADGAALVLLVDSQQYESSYYTITNKGPELGFYMTDLDRESLSKFLRDEGYPEGALNFGPDVIIEVGQYFKKGDASLKSTRSAIYMPF